jgi:hypothetical protein
VLLAAHLKVTRVQCAGSVSLTIRQPAACGAPTLRLVRRQAIVPAVDLWQTMSIETYLRAMRSRSRSLRLARLVFPSARQTIPI